MKSLHSAMVMNSSLVLKSQNTVDDAKYDHD